MTLSESLYTREIQCKKAFWLNKYMLDVLATPDESTLAIFETGNIVGDLAYELFPNRKEVPSTKDYDEMIAATKGSASKRNQIYYLKIKGNKL